jgi:protein-arginine kinase activator protein McsA
MNTFDLCEECHEREYVWLFDWEHGELYVCDECCKEIELDAFAGCYDMPKAERIGE